MGSVKLYLQNSDDEEDLNETLQSSPHLFGYVKCSVNHIDCVCSSIQCIVIPLLSCEHYNL